APRARRPLNPQRWTARPPTARARRVDEEQPRAAIQVAAAIIERDGRVLVARRAPGRHMAGHWEFPGGKLEPGETPQACIVRELAEELGVAVVAGEVIMESRHAYPGGENELVAVPVRLEGGELRETHHDASDTPRHKE